MGPSVALGLRCVCALSATGSCSLADAPSATWATRIARPGMGAEGALGIWALLMRSHADSRSALASAWQWGIARAHARPIGASRVVALGLALGHGAGHA